jgi:hypothetical protein
MQRTAMMRAISAREHDKMTSTPATSTAASAPNIAQVAGCIPKPELHDRGLTVGPWRHVGDDTPRTPAPFKLDAIHGGLVAREPAAVRAGHGGALRGGELPIRIHQPTDIGSACVDDL